MKNYFFTLVFCLSFFSNYAQVDYGVFTYEKKAIKERKYIVDTFKTRPLGNRSAFSKEKDSKYKELLNRKAQKVFENMVFVEKGNFQKSSIGNIHLTEFDTQLMSVYFPFKTNVANFLMSKYEVTNKEYREFVYWVRDSVVRAALAYNEPDKYYYKNSKILNWEVPIDWENKNIQNAFIKIYDDEYGYDSFFITENLDYSFPYQNGLIRTIKVYPDTLSWIREFEHVYNNPMTQLYFWHPGYDNYPVVGVSWQQAYAYCQWRTIQFRKENPDYKNLEFRLPTENEWEYAVKKSVFGEEGFSWIRNEDAVPQNCNHGDIRDENLITAVSSIDDGFILTGPVNSYSPNRSGIYNLQGNVAEWTSDKPKISIIEDLLLEEYGTSNPDYDSLKRNGLIEINDSTNVNDLINIFALLNQNAHDLYWNVNNEFGRIFLKKMLHDRDIVQNTENPRIVKGGSFADPTIYLIPSTRVVQSVTSQSCKIGFRLALSVDEEMLPLILKKKIYKKLIDKQKGWIVIPSVVF